MDSGHHFVFNWDSPMKRCLCLIAACILLSPLSAICWQGAGQNSQQTQASVAPLTNKDILEMLKVGLSPEIVVAEIKASACPFDTSPAALKELKSAAVPDAVILAMVQASSSQPTNTKLPEPNPEQPLVGTSRA